MISRQSVRGEARYDVPGRPSSRRWKEPSCSGPPSLSRSSPWRPSRVARPSSRRP